MMTRASVVLLASVLLGAAPYGSAAEFLHAPAHQTGLAPYEAALADMDGDGDQDVVTVDLQDQEVGTVSVSLNDGAGGFSAPAFMPVTLRVSSSTWRCRSPSSRLVITPRLSSERATRSWNTCSSLSRARRWYSIAPASSPVAVNNEPRLR